MTSKKIKHNQLTQTLHTRATNSRSSQHKTIPKAHPRHIWSVSTTHRIWLHAQIITRSSTDYSRRLFCNHRLQKVMQEAQTGIRKGSGTRDQIASIRWFVGRAVKYGKTIFMCFIDYSKAFDCVDHNRLSNTVRNMGVLEHLIALSSRACTRTRKMQ